MVHVMRDTHPTTIGDEVTVGHSAVLHGCTIEDRVLVGMGAMLLNGAHIGADSIVAAAENTNAGFLYPFPDKNALARALIERHLATAQQLC